MDPNETLKEMRNLAELMLSGALPEQEVESAALELAAYFQAMDSWLSWEGFLPKEWEK